MISIDLGELRRNRALYRKKITKNTKSYDAFDDASGLCNAVPRQYLQSSPAKTYKIVNFASALSMHTDYISLCRLKLPLLI